MRNFFGVDDPFVRPTPKAPWRRDVLVAAVLMLLALTGLLGMAGLETFEGEVRLVWSIPVSLLAGVLIVFRRRWPVATLLATTGAHFFIVGVTLPLVSVQTGMQVLYFLGLYSAMAWARNREALMLAVLAVVLLMGGWVAYDVATGTAAHRLEYDSVPTMFLVSRVLINVAYFGGALWLGRNAWLRARSDAALEESRAQTSPANRGAHMTKVLLVDDQAMVRSAFALMLSVEEDIELVGQCGDGLEAVELAASTGCDVILMDIEMPRMNGIDATRAIRAAGGPEVIVLTTFDRDDYLFEALQAGAAGFLLKNAEPEKLLESIRTVADGGALLAPEVTRRVIAEAVAGRRQALQVSPGLARLTDRERDVLVHMAPGAVQPGDCPGTVRGRGHREDPRVGVPEQARGPGPRPGRHPRLPARSGAHTSLIPPP